VTPIARVKAWANSIKRDVVALWLAARDPRTPWYAKLVAAAVAAYALSPIDLIPDFIPVIGYLDDLVIVPLGILAAVALVPPNLMSELRIEATKRIERPMSRVAAAVFVLIWLAVAIAVGWMGWSYLRSEISN
jgi:uncharacterized membrane protein YkvA (DUF1232 family)